MRTVGQVARLVGITVRTLHHYDEIGLLRPSTRTAAGYRLYHRADLERLQEILFWRELGYGLEEIRAVLDDPGHDRLTSLRHQLKELRTRADHRGGRVGPEGTGRRHPHDGRGDVRGPLRRLRPHGARGGGRGAVGRHGRLRGVRAPHVGATTASSGSRSRPSASRSKMTSSHSSTPAPIPSAPTPSPWPSRTASTSAGGSTSAHRRSTASSGRCTPRTRGSRSTTTAGARVWSCTSTTRSSRTPLRSPLRWEGLAPAMVAVPPRTIAPVTRGAATPTSLDAPTSWDAPTNTHGAG